METSSKNRILFWILIFLIVLNVSAMISFWLYYARKNKPVAETGAEKPGWALQQELSLSPEQTEAVAGINVRYRNISVQLAEDIREKKTELMSELSAGQTDTAKAYSIVDELAVLRNQLQESNIRQFLELKKVCTPSQVEKLSAIYSEFYGCENRGQGKGTGTGGGMRHRHRYGQQGDDTIK